MSLAGKVFAIISFVLAIFYVGITSALVSLQENYKLKHANEVVAHQKTKDLGVEDKKVADNQIELLTLERDGLRKKYGEAQAQNTLLEREWVTATDTIRFANTVIKDQADQIERQQARLDRTLKDLAARGTANDALSAKIAELEGSLVELGKKRDLLDDKLIACENELGNITKVSARLADELDYAIEFKEKCKAVYPDIHDELIRTESKDLVTKVTIRGKATAVDAKLGLVVINAGQRQGVTKGISFIVFRGETYVGKIIVDEIFPDVSACRYDRDHMQRDVEVGDDVTTKLAVDF